MAKQENLNNIEDDSRETLEQKQVSDELKEISEVPVPGGKIPESMLWESRVDQGTMEEKGVYDPDRKFYHFKNGERFAQIRGEEGGERKPFIIDKDDNKIPFEDWAKEQDEK